MACKDCGSKISHLTKHLLLPNSHNGWVELSEWTDYCADCAGKEAIKMDEIFRKSMEGVKNG